MDVEETLGREMSIEETIMYIIIYSGEAKGYLYEALSKSKEGKYDEIDELIEKANDSIGKAHDIQTSMLQKEAKGEPLKVTILFVHSQDHLMTTISEKNLILEIIELRRLINPLLGI
jgi:PTS system cellobiose-specific IIA component